MATASKQTSPLWEILFPSEGDPNLATYTILDGAACEDLLPMLEMHAPDHCCLYAGDLDDDVEEVAPYLVRLEADHPFTAWLLEAIGQKPWGIFCKAPSTLRELRKHFRQFLIVKGPEGGNLYFRYYDPRVFSTFLPSCESIQVGVLFGPVDVFFTLVGTMLIQSFRHDQGTLSASVAHQGVPLKPSAGGWVSATTLDFPPNAPNDTRLGTTPIVSEHWRVKM